MRVPIILLSGQAGSGKDTVADFFVENHGAVKIAQADPMKRLVMQLFGFTEDQLWGPSERRKELAPGGYWDSDLVEAWLKEVLPGVTRSDNHLAKIKLLDWANSVCELNERNNFGNVRRPPPSARHVLQTLGTEWGRNFSKNMWVDYALRAARNLLEGEFSYSRTQGVQSNTLRVGKDVHNLVVITDGRFRNEILSVRAAGGITVKIVSPLSGLSGEASKHASETEQNSIPDSWFDFVLENDKTFGFGVLKKQCDDLASKMRESPQFATQWGCL